MVCDPKIHQWIYKSPQGIATPRVSGKYKSMVTLENRPPSIPKHQSKRQPKRQNCQAAPDADARCGYPLTAIIFSFRVRVFAHCSKIWKCTFNQKSGNLVSGKKWESYIMLRVGAEIRILSVRNLVLRVQEQNLCIRKQQCEPL